MGAGDAHPAGKSHDWRFSALALAVLLVIAALVGLLVHERVSARYTGADKIDEVVAKVDRAAKLVESLNDSLVVVRQDVAAISANSRVSSVQLVEISARIKLLEERGSDDDIEALKRLEQELLRRARGDAGANEGRD